MLANRHRQIWFMWENTKWIFTLYHNSIPQVNETIKYAEENLKTLEGNRMSLLLQDHEGF